MPRGTVKSEREEEPQVSVAIVQAIVETGEARGIDREQLLAAVDLSTEELEDERGLVPLVHEQAAWQRVLERNPGPGFGIEVAQRLRRGSFRELEYMLRSSETFGDALSRLVVFDRILRGRDLFALDVGPQEVHLTYFGVDDRDPNEPMVRATTEFALAALLRLGRDAVNIAWAPLLVRFRQRAPEDIARYREHFGCELVWDQEQDVMVLDPTLLEQPMVAADAQLCSVLEDCARGRMPERDGVTSFAETVRMVLSGHLSEGCTIDVVANRLSISRRQLQRRLAEEDTTFQSILDDVREQVAKNHLLQGLPLPGIAMLLGYSDVTGFHRAFRRWTGSTPASFRREALAGESRHEPRHSVRPRDDQGANAL